MDHSGSSKLLSQIDLNLPEKPDQNAPSEAPSHPDLWTVYDSPGHDGVRERRQRQDRLGRSIELSVYQLYNILLFIDRNGDSKGVKWTPEFLFTYVPTTFETAVVSEYSALKALDLATKLNLARHIPE